MVNKEKSKATVPVKESDKLKHFKTHCPLCHTTDTQVIHRDAHSKIDREYLSCAKCDLTFVPKEYHLPPDQEKAIYDCHENNPNDHGYRKFLSKLAIPLTELLPASARGLDFGCGPGPTLSLMMRESGFEVDEYDPYYKPNTEPLTRKYDFITSTEVVEHISKPNDVFEKLFNMLNDGGVLGIMTKRTPDQGIVNWHYTKDPTHITFYSDKTFMYLADRFKCQLKFISNDTALLIKKY